MRFTYLTKKKRSESKIHILKITMSQTKFIKNKKGHNEIHIFDKDKKDIKTNIKQENKSKRS